RRPAVSVRHADGEPQRRCAPRPAVGIDAEPSCFAAGRHGVRRLLHDVLDVDAGNPTARRGAPDLAGGRQHRRQRRARRGRRGARPMDRGPAVNDQCLKLTAYFNERQRTAKRFLAEDLLRLFGERQLATSVMLRGIGSFGPRQELRSDEWLSMSEDRRAAGAAVDTRNKMTRLIDDVVELTPRGLITLERARLITGDVTNFVASDADATKLTLYVGRQEHVDGSPAYYAICDLLH